MTTFRGKQSCSCLNAWIPAFEKAIGRTVTWWQLVGDAPDSAGFHKGGGSADCPTLSEKELRIARNMGGAAWNRWWKNNFHCHIRLNGCPHNTTAQRQVPDLNAGRDGTGPLSDSKGTRDNGPRDDVHFPLRTWQEGIRWAEEEGDPKMALLNDLRAVCRKHGVSRIYAARTLLKSAANDPETPRWKKARVNAARTPLYGIDDPKK